MYGQILWAIGNYILMVNQQVVHEQEKPGNVFCLNVLGKGCKSIGITEMVGFHLVDGIYLEVPFC